MQDIFLCNLMYNLFSCYVDTDKRYKLKLTPAEKLLSLSVDPLLTSDIASILVCSMYWVVFNYHI